MWQYIQISPRTVKKKGKFSYLLTLVSFQNLYDFNSSLKHTVELMKSGKWKINCAYLLGKNQWGLHSWAYVYHIL